MNMKKLCVLVMAFASVALFAKSKGLKTLTIGDLTLEPEDTLSFSVDGLPDEIAGMEVLSEFLPDGTEVTWTGKKFKTPKAGKVKYSKKEGDFVATKEDNPAGLKLSISKNGRVTGSFKIYVAKSEKKVKAYTAKVSGSLTGEIKVTMKGASGSAEATLE